jgi:hypothetical protein
VRDAGTDPGTTHHADDVNAQPRQNTRLAAGPQFLGEKGLRPVGTVTFTKVKNAATN